MLAEKANQVEFEDLYQFVEEGTFKQEEALEQFEEVDYKFEETKDQLNKKIKENHKNMSERLEELDAKVDNNFNQTSLIEWCNKDREELTYILNKQAKEIEKMKKQIAKLDKKNTEN